MELSEHLSAEQVLLNLRVRDKWELLDRMVAALQPRWELQGRNEEAVDVVREAIRRREREMATWMGEGLAFPHARIAGLLNCPVCLATVDGGVDFESNGDGPVRVVCMILIPQENPGVGLQVMSGLAALFSDPVVQDVIRAETDPLRLHEFLCRQDVSLDGPVVASDIMQAKSPSIPPDMPLRDVTRTMHEKHAEAMPVVDPAGHIMGEVTCDLLFRKGIPDFFTQLSSVSFIREFDPFEKYFAEESRLSAQDVMTRDFAAVAENATLIEIIYLLCVRRHTRVYVERDGVKVGVIDRSTVLDRILNL